MRRDVFLAISLGGLFVLLMAVPTAWAWESYHDPGQDDAGYCSSCHPGFTGGKSDTLHQLHVANPDPVTGTCDLCHAPDKDNPLLMWSVGDSNDGLGCMGCHGSDYGETISADYQGYSTAGLSKASGYGLRLHHSDHGVTSCVSCHSSSAPPGGIRGEHVNPPYYSRADVSVGGSPMNACTNEDTANDADTTALDNDGDDLYEGADPDCTSPPTPGEPSALTVTAHNPGTSTLTLSYTPGGCTTENTIVYGPLDQVSTYNYTGCECFCPNLWPGETMDWDYTGTPDSMFFILVGTDFTNEGSYGRRSSGLERPNYPSNPTCFLDQNLGNTCP